MLIESDVAVLRELATKYAEIASLPIHDEKRKMWMDLNTLHMQRPMVMMDQLPWSELAALDPTLKCVVQDPYWRGVEDSLRKSLYQWRHFPVDRVYEKYILLPRPIPYEVWNGTGWGGIEVKRTGEERYADIGAEISSSAYANQITCLEDIEKIEDPVIKLDTEKEAKIIEEAHFLFDGIVEFRMRGVSMHLGIWDTVSMWMGVENCYIAMYDDPELLHALMNRLTEGMIRTAERLNAIRGIDIYSNICHCSHTYLPDMPKEGDLGLTGNAWACGLAQLFTSVSPSLMDEFEVTYMKRLFPYFGAINYGCCDRLDDRMDVIRKLPKIRKLSCSPWSDREHFAETMPDYCVMVNKPNPSFLAEKSYDEENTRQDIRRTIAAAKAYDRNLEFIQKDVSTVLKDPSRLDRWAAIAMEEVCR